MRNMFSLFHNSFAIDPILVLKAIHHKDVTYIAIKKVTISEYTDLFS